MFVIKAMFALCYISVNVMAIVTVFRFEDVSRATLSAFGSSSSSGSSLSLLPVVEALNVQVDNHRASSVSQSQLRQHEQQRPDLSLSMRTVAEGGLFPVSQGTDIFNNNNNNDVAAPTSIFSNVVDEQTLVEEMQQQHEQMQKMMQLMQPQQQEQQETSVISPSFITTKEIGKTQTSVSSTVRSTTTSSSGRMSTLLKGIRLSSADNDRHPMQPQPTKKTLNTSTSSIIKQEGMPLPRLSSAMANGDRKLGPISYKMIVQDLRTQDIQKQNERDERMTILGIYLASVSSPFDDDDDNEHEQHTSAIGPVSPCWKQKHNLVVSI